MSCLFFQSHFALCFLFIFLWTGRLVVMHRANELRGTNRENENTHSEITGGLVLE